MLRPMVEEIDCENLAAENVLLVDVRERHEWDAGHIDGARHLPLSLLQHDPGLFTPPEDGRTCVLYCQRGVRSQRAADIILAAGTDGNAALLSLRGGYEAWLLSR